MSCGVAAIPLMLGDACDLGKLIAEGRLGDEYIEEAEEAAASCFIISSCFSRDCASHGVASFAGSSELPGRAEGCDVPPDGLDDGRAKGMFSEVN